jgi:hypothetical protein
MTLCLLLLPARSAEFTDLKSHLASPLFNEGVPRHGLDASLGSSRSPALAPGIAAGAWARLGSPWAGNEYFLLEYC